MAVIALVAVAILTEDAAATPSQRQAAAWTARSVAAGSCEGLTALTLPNTVVTSASVAPPSGATPASCRVHATVTHPPAGDTVNIDVWLPVEGWNGRFMGVGGGYSGGSPQSLAAPVSQGYAAGSTDTGHVGGSGDFALDANGRLDWQLIRDFARLFLAPGVAHCAGGAGPSPDNPLQAVVDWVEHGRAPRVLHGVKRDANGAVVQTRPICLYPEVAAYKGHGDVAVASSFACRRPS